MDIEYRFHANAQWTADRGGQVQGSDGIPELEFAAPPEFHGPGGVWSPEDFFLAAITSCFITTFRAIAEFSRFHFDQLRVSAEGTVEKSAGGYKFTRVVLRPVLAIGREEDRERAQRMLEKTERSCLISRSVQPDIVLEPVVEVGELVHNA